MLNRILGWVGRDCEWRMGWRLGHSNIVKTLVYLFAHMKKIYHGKKENTDYAGETDKNPREL